MIAGGKAKESYKGVINMENKIINNNGIYIEIFAMKDGERYNFKTINLKEVSNILVNSLMNGIEAITIDPEIGVVNED